ncbi:MAG TPA: ABC transporter permease [Thermoanaerobaculia bacterium]|jgi:ABC-2 type transport system permease protein
MNKFLAVFKREYLQIVRKKMFIVMTFLLPALMAGALVLPSLLASRGMGEKKVTVVDGTGLLAEAFHHAAVDPTKEVRERLGRGDEEIGKVNITYVKASANVEADAKPYLDQMTITDKAKRLDAVLIIPADALEGENARMKFYSRTATDFITQTRLSSQANRAIQRHRLTAKGMNPEDIDRALTNVRTDSVQLSKTGEQKKGGIANFFIGFVLTALVLLPAFIYGMEVMRGIIQEKTDRVVEVLVSSMSPMQLLVGKISGVAAVGLTQVAVWFAMAGGIGAYLLFVASMAGENFGALLRPATFLYFLLFFVLAYLTYVCIYAIAGAICNSEKEAQQLIAPIVMIMMLPWFLLVGIITNPDSPMSVGFSMAPVFGPITMYVRTLVSDPPVWHILVSVAVSVATIALFFWITAKIFRIGLLSYGKRPTIPEMWRWLKVA